MVAGSDTAASAIRATILHLITTPRVYQKFKKVIREAIQDGRVSSPIKQEEAKKIPYLQVCKPNFAYSPYGQKDHKLIFARP